MSLTYVEGYAVSATLSATIPMLHAWLVDPNGNVVDPTWDDSATSTYFGVPFDPDHVRRFKITRKRSASLIDNFEHRWPLLQPDADLEGVFSNRFVTSASSFAI